MSQGPHRAGSADAQGETPARWGMLGLVSLATLLSLTVWFTTNAVAPALQEERGYSGADIAWLTIGVQLGFVAGTLAIALTNLADLVRPRVLFAVCAVLAAGSNAALVIAPESLPATLATRLLTGMFLGGVYPVGMKIVAGWFRGGRGLAIGIMVGALTLGSGSPHLLRAFFTAEWRVTVLAASALTLAAAAVAFLLTRDGPFDAPAQRFDPRFVFTMLRARGPRLVLLGYLGHMWELYAMWAWVPAFLAHVYGDRRLAGDMLGMAGAVSFLVFAAGAAGCALGGRLADRHGRTVVTAGAMILSGGMALCAGFLPVEWGLVIAAVALVWGASVIADSAQFSTALTELADPSYRGTALTFQTGLGFLLTVLTIRLVPVLRDGAGWGVAFAFLAIGPALGAAAMLRLRALPESKALASGRR